MYGKYRIGKSASGSYRGAALRPRNRPATFRKGMGKRYNNSVKLPRFATVGFARNVEKKYFDKTYQSNSFETLSGATTSVANNGVTYISNTWGTYTFGTQAASAATSNDMFKGLDTGTTARTRIGNKLKPNYIKGAFTFTAGLTNIAAGKAQNGEALDQPVASTTQQYLRTTFRMLIVKDLQVNSTDVQVQWNQVMDTTGLQAGIHSELNVDNMGRFIVLEDKIFTCDAQNPQKTCPFMINGSRVGSVRYNGPSSAALTDKGLYIVWAAFIMGVDQLSLPDVSMPSPVGHSRLCFTDD